jgi:hypothetical protein
MNVSKTPLPRKAFRWHPTTTNLTNGLPESGKEISRMQVGESVPDFAAQSSRPVLRCSLEGDETHFSFHPCPDAADMLWDRRLSRLRQNIIRPFKTFGNRVIPWSLETWRWSFLHPLSSPFVRAIPALPVFPPCSKLYRSRTLPLLYKNT